MVLQTLIPATIVHEIGASNSCCKDTWNSQRQRCYQLFISSTHNVSHEWVIGVRFRHEQLNCSQKSTDVQSRTPTALFTAITDTHS